VSLGVQSLNAAVLEWMHRPHGPQAPALAVQTLRAAGYPVHLGRPHLRPAGGAGPRSERRPGPLLALGPSTYPRTGSPWSRAHRWIGGSSVARTKPADEERYGEEFLRLDDRLTREGFESLRGVELRARHQSRAPQSAYWTGATVCGLGPAAHRYTDGTARGTCRSGPPMRRASPTAPIRPPIVR